MLKHLLDELLKGAEKVLNCVGAILNSTPEQHPKLRQSPIFRQFKFLKKTGKRLIPKRPFASRKNIKAKGAPPNETRHFNQPR